MPSPRKPSHETVVRVPGGKSEAIRALLVGALARGTTRITGAPGAEDVLAVVAALEELGVRVDGVPGAGVLRVRGTLGQFPPGDLRVHLGGSATGLRMLSCVAALRTGRTTLEGDASLRSRPVGPLATPLRSLGVTAKLRRGRPPVVVSGGPARMPRGEVAVDASRTSQLASGLLLLGPFLPGGLRLRLKGRAVSEPYILLTMDVLRRAGVRVRRAGRVFQVPEGVPAPFSTEIEADWSSAAYPLLAGALLRRRVRVPGLRPRSPQADRVVLDLLRAAGARCGLDASGAWCRGSGPLKGFEVDLRSSPDLAPVAAVLGMFAGGRSRVTGAAHLKGKESDRIATCVAAVRALGGTAVPRPDGFDIRGGIVKAGVVDAAGDHRVALAFSVAAAAIPGARVRGTACVRKSWPGGIEDMAHALRR